MEMVLRYQEQRLDALRAEHAAAIARTREQETVVDRLRSFRSVNGNIVSAKAHGITVADADGLCLCYGHRERKYRLRRRPGRTAQGKKIRSGKR